MIPVPRPSLLVLLLAGCPRPVPDHLQLKPDPASRITTPITDATSALSAIIGRDPLARSPLLPDPSILDALEGGAPLAAFVRQVRTVELGQGSVERVLQQVEDDWRASPAVPLARGYRLRLAENELASVGTETEAAHRQVVVLITPLGAGGEDPTLPRRPLEWLTEGDRPEVVRAYAERWVLTSWLATPEIPLSVLTRPLGAPQYDGLRESPVGRLVASRAAGASGDPTAGIADLRRATSLALQRAAADRDAEQSAWADAKNVAAAELTDPDPIGKLLERSAASLTEAALSDRAAGGALLSLAALRWIDRCGAPPCTGVDRVEVMQFASRWDPEIAELAAIWQVVAMKETLDSLEVGRDTALFPELMVDLADALLGTGAGPLEASLLRKQRPDAQVWLSVSRAVGTEGVTDWEGARLAVGQHLAREVARAAALTADPDLRSLLERVGNRAVP